MARERELTPRQVELGINKYFKSIVKTVPLYESVLVGKDKDGKNIYEQQEVLNDLGKPVTRVECFEHPSMTKLAHYLGITRDTLWRYGKLDEYSDSIKRAKEIIESYLEDKLYGNNVTGIIFNLKNNYGWEDRTKHDLNVEKSIEDFFGDA